ncbi:uncharacterized protein LOC130736346 [Lotus japonicus]|uniref:uncharacterized protein LOC130736346 n=1 Tax=Lotus japonicus TaxID=34305 RepID=UPI00258440D2|nr:uncharacterized protein LOC130736346 [Lotus japonicus]
MPPLMEPEPVMNLLDSFWCEQNVVSKNSCSSPSSAENQIQTSHTRSMSDQSSIVKNKKKKKKRRLRRSVSQLELKELKGFMDLGFTFSEKDKNSRLASVLPGLKRLGKKREEKEEEVVISRPYLSEAWEFLKDEKPCY